MAIGSGSLIFKTNRDWASLLVEYSYDNSKFYVDEVYVKITQWGSISRVLDGYIKLNGITIYSSSGNNFIPDTTDWWGLGISGNITIADSVEISFHKKNYSAFFAVAGNGDYQFKIEDGTSQTVVINSSGGDNWGDDDYEETYTVTLDKGGYTWDDFPSVTKYYGYWNETINLPTPERYNSATPAGNFEIVGNLNSGETSIEIHAIITKLTNYTFEGWKDLHDNKVYSTMYEIYSDTTLEAQQSSSSTLIYTNNKIENLGNPTRDEEEKIYTITYNYADGDKDRESETSKARLSYKFDYWCSNSSGTGTKYDKTYEFKKNNGEKVNVYAIWTTTVEEPAIINLPTTKREGYKFKGWTTADQAILYEAGTSVEVTKDTNFIAVWETEGRIFIHDGTRWIPVI